jgi:aryl-phospho-beta-D-glucosidase BglC (GH1 family)
MEAIGGETAWGNPEVSAGVLALVKASGFDAIRIPAAWDQYAEPDTARIDPAWLDRVKSVVQLAIDQDLDVIVNIHWDGGWLENNVTPGQQDEVIARQRAYWQQIATRLREFDDRLLFASANEPNAEDAEQVAVLNAYHQAFVGAVRCTGGRNAHRVLVLQGPKTDIETTDALWTSMPVDTVAGRLMAELHFYTPYNFTLMSQDESWGKQFYYWGAGNHSATDPERNPTWGEEDTVDALLAMAKRQFVDQGIPVIIGEFGAQRRDNLTGEVRERHLESRAYWLEYVTRQSLANGLLPFYWDTGGLDNNQSGIFDRRALTVFDQQALDALMRGAGK